MACEDIGDSAPESMGGDADDTGRSRTELGAHQRVIFAYGIES